MKRPVRSLGLGLVLALCTGRALAADRVAGSAGDGYGRIAFILDQPARLSAAVTGGVLTIAFDRKTSLDPVAVAGAMPRFIASGHADADGKTLRFALSEAVRLHVSQQGARAVVDLAPSAFTGAMPDLPPPAPLPPPKPVDPATLPAVTLRAGSYNNFTRLVFDFAKDPAYAVFPGAGKIGIRFDTLVRPDLSVIARLAPAWVKNASWRTEGNTTLVEFETDSDAGYHDFKDGTHVVLDILAPKTDAAAYVPPGTAKPAATVMSAAQSKAITDTAAALAPKKPAPAPEVKIAAAKPPAAPPPQPVMAPPQPAPPAATAESRVTQGGALLTFKGAASHGAAVFIRGLTAWVVLENAPNFDAAALKAGLGDFAAGLEASSGPGVSILRVLLKSPAPIAARAAGPDLKVMIGAGPSDAPTAIDFARNQSDPRRASLTAVLANADRVITLSDPATGDSLTLVPAGPGPALPNAKTFADFAALASAQGLVIAPYTDDLAVQVGDGRVTISRPAGLALTPPQTPTAASPAALAHAGGGPSFLDFAHWGALSGGSFLATERALRRNIADAQPPQRNAARLQLARFYLAQGFGAESLGLIGLIQSADPALKGDIQLSAMRGAADYEMGRARDAHNDLAGPNFDSDPHAGLWRGLTEAALENWNAAYSDLEAADAVLPHYPIEWQARARLAAAQSALGSGRLDEADVALQRLPKNLPPALALEAKLDAGRIAAAEKRYPAAANAFAQVEQSGNERLAAQAIFYRTDSALAAGTMSDSQAIVSLERLRFRWRGDALEMKTLRKLAALYFAGRHWREGLKTLRVATQNFSGDDARTAQDDMRGAFVNLYLKGDADKMAPVDSLGLFYDNIDLTPIGPDGDEMIRRMADRLVAMDLLGPAQSLLAYQVDKRLDGVAKAQVSTKLAAVYLMDEKPDAAVQALRGSEIAGLPDDLSHARLILEARAFAALKQYDNALDLVAVDQAADTSQLRADIYWESGNWAVAGQKIEALLADRWSDAPPLNDKERADVLRAAVAYSLASDEASLDRLRDHFTPKMKSAPDAGLFAVLSQPLEMHALAFRDAARAIAQVDTLQSFMKDFTRNFDAGAPRS